MTVWLVLLLAVLAISSASVLIKLCDAPAMVIASYRLTVASLFFLTASAVRNVRILERFERRDLLLAGAAGAFLCLHFATWITSLKYTSVANSVVLVSTAPIFVGIGSFLFLREPVHKLVGVGLILTVAGAVLLGLSESEGRTGNSTLGDLLALTGAVGGAGYFLLGRRLRPRMPTLAYVTVVYSTTAVLLLLLTVALGFRLVGYPTEVYVLLAAIALVPQVIGHTGLNWALRFVSATTVAVATLGEPIGATLLAVLVLGEKVTAFQGIGGMLILTGVALALRGETVQAALD